MHAPGDKKALRGLLELCQGMTADEIERFCEGTMNAIIVAQHVFKQRFPEQWQRFNDKIDAGASGFAVTEL